MVSLCVADFTGTDGAAWPSGVGTGFILGQDPSGGGGGATIAPVGTPHVTSFAASGTSFVFSTTSAANAGDTLVAVFTYNPPSTSDVTSTVPAGWTAVGTGIFDIDTGTTLGSARMLVATKVAAGGAESATWTTASTVSNAAVSVQAYTGVNTTTPFSAFGYLAEASSVTAHVTPSVTPGVSGSWLVGAWAVRNNRDLSPPVAVTGGGPAMTERAANVSANGGAGGTSGMHLEVADTNGGAVSSATAYTYSSSEAFGTGCAVMFLGSLQPAAGGGGSGGATLSGGRGRLATGATGGHAAGDRITRRANITAVADAEALFSWSLDATDCLPAFSARSTTTALTGATDYQLSLGSQASGDVVLSKNVAGVNTVLGTIAANVTANVAMTARFRIIGNLITVRVWAAGATEPASWNLTVTDGAVAAAGHWGFINAGGAAAATANVFIDDFTLTDGTGAGLWNRFPDRGALDTQRYQSLIMSVRVQEPVQSAQPPAYGTVFLYHYDNNGVLIDEQVVRFTGDNANPIGSGFLCYPLIQVPCIGVTAVLYVIFDTPGRTAQLSITGSYRAISTPRVFNGGAYFGSGGWGSKGGGGVDGWVSWTAQPGAGLFQYERPYCWSGPAVLTVDVAGAIASPGVDVLIVDDISGRVLAGQRGLTVASSVGQVFTFPVNIPCAPIRFFMRNQTAGSIPAVTMTLTTELSA